VEFYLPETGWFPIDASEAFKQPERKEYFYGTHPTNRIHFSTGRDLKLGAAQQAQPLNYFIYPHVEIDGKPYTENISKQFAFRSLGANQLSARPLPDVVVDHPQSLDDDV
jgi:hypothetical protein